MHQNSRRVALRIFKVVAWVFFAVILFVVGMVMATVTMLKPEELTPLVNVVANKVLNADVSIDKIAVSGDRKSQYVYIDVDGLSICSREMKSLPQSVRDTIPAWGDTLISLKHFHGGINIAHLFTGVVDLRDISLTHPQINILVVNEATNNFSIIPPSSDTSTSAVSLPDIRINRLDLIDPAPIRFADLPQKFDMTADIITMSLANDSMPKGYFPAYNVDFACNIQSPALEIIGREDVPVSLNGLVEWHYERPYALVLRDMDFALLSMSGRLNTNVDFSNLMTVETFDLKFNPVEVNDLLSLIPAPMARNYDIPARLDTEAQVQLSVLLHRPFTVGQILMPYATANIVIPECGLKYEKVDLRRFAADVDVEFAGGSADQITVDIKSLLAQGPASDFTFKGSLATLMSDPHFDGYMKGNIAIGHMPSMLASRIGAVMSGDLRLDAHIGFVASMFSLNKFHNIKLDGDIELNKFYYLTYDTLAMVSVPQLKGRFGAHDVSIAKGGMVDSLLRGTVEADSADILVSGLDIRLGQLKLGLAANNTGRAYVPNTIMPMGGKISAASFSLLTISDTAGVKVKNLLGDVSMERYKQYNHLPTFKLNLHLDRLSTGSKTTRLMVNDGDLIFNISKLPVNAPSKDKPKARSHHASVRSKHVEIPVDSVYVYAKEIRSRHRRKGHRVHTVQSADSVEVLEWGTSSSFYKFAHYWEWNGSLNTGAARLFAPSFPVRNRVKNLDISFNNDSLTIVNMQYKAGRSDFLISGQFSNIKDGFTTDSVPLKANLSLISDTIDINEIAKALFTGDSRKEAKPDKDNNRHNDTPKPFLIPVNLDAKFDFKAHHMSYADLLLDNFTGELLLYDGAINLHEFNASSRVGALNLNALYYAPSVKDMNFGFGLRLNDFNIRNFLKIVPAVDSMMPVMRGLRGIVNANVAASSKIDKMMNLDLPSLKAAIRIEGDSLSFLDPKTFNKIAKWLLFKNKNRNIIDHVTAELTVDNGELRVYPFIFDFDRYRLGIQGYNDMALNFHYHVAVLKSPLPFKFGINISGRYDDMKVRFGGAKFNEKQAAEQVPVVNNMRINLVNQIQNVFRRGVKNADFSNLIVTPTPVVENIDLEKDALTPSDSIYLRREGLIP